MFLPVYISVICDSCCWCWDTFRSTGIINVYCFRNSILWKCNVIFKTLFTDSKKCDNEFLLLLVFEKHQVLSGALMDLWIRSPSFLYSSTLRHSIHHEWTRTRITWPQVFKVSGPSWPVTNNLRWLWSNLDYPYKDH